MLDKYKKKCNKTITFKFETFKRYTQVTRLFNPWYKLARAQSLRRQISRKHEEKWKVSCQGLCLVMYLYVCVTELHHLLHYYSETTMQIYTPNTNKEAFNENIQRAKIKQSVLKR